MSGRPGGNPPDWASTVAYPAGSDPWSGTPTKVDPGVTLTAQGAQPGAFLPAQVVNWLLSELGVWVRYQDTLEVRNFTDPAVPDASGNELATLWQDSAACYEPTNRKYFIGGSDQTDDNVPLVLWSANGESWNDDFAPVLTPGTTQSYQIVGSPDHGIFAWIRHGSSSPEYRRGINGTWSTLSLTTVQLHQAGVWFQDRWIIVGKASGPIPSAYSFLPSGTSGSAGTWTHLTLPGASGVTLVSLTTMIIASRDDVGVVIVAPSPVLSNGTPQGDVWHSPDGATFTHVTTPFLGRAVNVVWNEGDQVFYAMCTGGYVYTSPDGGTWTQQSTTAPSFRGSNGNGSDINVGAGAALGGVVIQQCAVTTPDSSVVPGLAVGWNLGTEWEIIQGPLNIPSFDDQPVACVQVVDNRLLLGRVDDPGNSRGTAVCYTLRVK